MASARRPVVDARGGDAPAQRWLTPIAASDQLAGGSRARSRLIETEVSVAVFAVAFRGPTGWLPNRLPAASAVAVWL
jgi:hypothetical protein